MGGLERDSMLQARQALPAAGLLGPARGQEVRGNECLGGDREMTAGESWQALPSHRR